MEIGVKFKRDKEIMFININLYYTIDRDNVPKRKIMQEQRIMFEV
jgi:hypothetical protein